MIAASVVLCNKHSLYQGFCYIAHCTSSSALHKQWAILVFMVHSIFKLDIYNRMWFERDL